MAEDSLRERSVSLRIDGSLSSRRGERGIGTRLTSRRDEQSSVEVKDNGFNSVDYWEAWFETCRNWCQGAHRIANVLDRIHDQFRSRLSLEGQRNWARTLRVARCFTFPTELPQTRL